MTVSRKHKRPITVDQRHYLWWVADDVDPPFVPSAGKSLRIVDTSGDLAVEYHLGQPAEVRHVVVAGPRFRGVTSDRGPHRRFRCPMEIEGTAVTPAHVAAFIRWCEEPDGGSTQVNYLGHALRSGPESNDGAPE